MSSLVVRKDIISCDALFEFVKLHQNIPTRKIFSQEVINNARDKCWNRWNQWNRWNHWNRFGYCCGWQNVKERCTEDVVAKIDVIMVQNNIKNPLVEQL